VIGTSYSLSSSDQHSTENLDPDSKSILARFAQPVKQDLPTYSTSAGRVKDRSEEQPQNAPFSIRASFDPDSKKMRESDVQQATNNR
jgi:hypothetical protein